MEVLTLRGGYLMDFKQIEAFISVAKQRSFSKAASSIFLSQPTISSHISSLEKELRVQLFDRTSKEVNLTPAGKYFLDYAVDIINTRNTAISNLSDFNDNICGSLNLAASTTPCSTMVPTLINKFSLLYPNIVFNITQQSSGEIINNIINLDCEVGIVGTIIDSDKIKSYPLLEDTLVIISNPKYNLPDQLPLESLSNYKFIMREKRSATRKTFEASYETITGSPLRLNVHCEVNNMDTLIELVKAGLGISISSYSVVSKYIDTGQLKCSTIENLPLKRNIYLVVNSKRTLTPTAKAFLDICKTHFNIEEKSSGL
jgi:DNA-binding transcriptional LysR family regulator